MPGKLAGVSIGAWTELQKSAAWCDFQRAAGHNHHRVARSKLRCRQYGSLSKAHGHRCRRTEGRESVLTPEKCACRPLTTSRANVAVVANSAIQLTLPRARACASDAGKASTAIRQRGTCSARTVTGRSWCRCLVRNVGSALRCQGANSICICA